MKDRVILLRGNYGFSDNMNRGAFILVGSIFVILGLRHLYTFTNNDWLQIMLDIFLGVGLLVYCYLFLSCRSKYAPKVVVDDEAILFKDKPLEPATCIKWKDIKEVTFRSYRIVFKKKSGVEVITYKTNPRKCEQIKKTLSEYAEMKSISVAD